MLLINKNSINEIFLTLQENSTLWLYSSITPYYLFSFKSDTTNQTINFVVPETTATSAISRYNKFTLIETGLTYQNLTAGTVNINPALFWSYTVYEQTSQYNTNPLLTVGVVEYGKVLLSGSTTNFPFTTATGTTFFYTA